MSRPRLVAFYLPQFHPTPENDRWWGKGFTEWRSVARARPVFEGHEQPDLPGELGFYDLRLPEVRQAQAELARDHGIAAFCYYHYWFHGRRLLSRPLDDMLASGVPDFPFCLCWANENWTRAWDGLDSELLIGQRYSAEDDREHLRFLARVFADRRYLRIDGRPLLLVYRTSALPDALSTAHRWREEARRLGVGELYLATVESLAKDRIDPMHIGFDAAVEFAPDWLSLPPVWRTLDNANRVFQYRDLAEAMRGKPVPSYRRFPCVTPGWDNTPRRASDCVVFSGATPAVYERWLRTTLESRQTPVSEDEDLVFINAWNEWAEGAHLEPGELWGRAHLEATSKVMGEQAAKGAPAERRFQVPMAPALAPRISVAMPTFNGARFLRAAITSVLAQSLDDLELVVTDDASNDETAAIVASFDDPRMRFVQNPRRLGLVGNWNHCLELTRGPLVTLFHQDDLMAPDNLARKAAMLQSDSDLGMVYSNVRQIDENGGVLSEYWHERPASGGPRRLAGREAFRDLARGVNPICAPSVVLRRATLEEVGGFDPTLPFTADWEMWMRVALHADVGFIPDALVDYRRHPEMETNRFLGIAELRHGLAAKRRILERFPDRVPDIDEVSSEVYRYYVEQARQRAVSARDLGHPVEAGELLEFAALITAEGLRVAGPRFRAWEFLRAGKAWSWRFAELRRWLGTRMERRS